MRLSCQKMLFLVAIVVMGCKDSTGPQTISKQFSLIDINGRALPTYLAPTPGLTPTIVSNTLTLRKDGTAETIEHRIEWNGTDNTLTYQQRYTIKGEVIEFAYDCPPGVDCFPPPRGALVGNALSLDVSGGSGAVIYHYQATSE